MLKPLHIVFDLLKSFDPSYSVLKFGNDLFSRNWDMAQNVVFQVCNLERSRSSMKVKKFSIRPPPPTHKYMCEVPLKCCQFLDCQYCQLQSFNRWLKGGQEKERIKREYDWNTLTQVDNLWCKLCHEGATWHKCGRAIIWRSFPELSFGISWVSKHWAIVETESPKLCL